MPRRGCRRSLITSFIQQGTLLVDPTVPELALDAHYILLRGGCLRAGASADAPHPGRLTITLWGDKVAARRLPTFGAKVRLLHGILWLWCHARR